MTAELPGEDAGGEAGQSSQRQSKSKLFSSETRTRGTPAAIVSMLETDPQVILRRDPCKPVLPVPEAHSRAGNRMSRRKALIFCVSVVGWALMRIRRSPEVLQGLPGFFQQLHVLVRVVVQNDEQLLRSADVVGRLPSRVKPS